MQLNDRDLSQLDVEELLNLSEEDLRHLSIKLLTDLKEARERNYSDPLAIGSFGTAIPDLRL